MHRGDRCGQSGRGGDRSVGRLSLRRCLVLRPARADAFWLFGAEADQQSGLLRDCDATGDRADAGPRRRPGAVLRRVRLFGRGYDTLGQERSGQAPRQPDALCADRTPARARGRPASAAGRIHAACRTAFPRADRYGQPASARADDARRGAAAVPRSLRRRTAGGRHRRGAMGQPDCRPPWRTGGRLLPDRRWQPAGRRLDPRQPAQGRRHPGAAESQSRLRPRRVRRHTAVCWGYARVELETIRRGRSPGLRGSAAPCPTFSGRNPA